MRQIFKFKFLASTLALTAMLVMPFFAHAQTSDGPPPDLVCDPLPVEDADKLAECLFWQGFFPDGQQFTSASNPTELSFSGTHGVTGVYNTQDNTYLVVGNDVDGTTITLQAALFDAETHAQLTSAFRIDQGTAFVGNPKAAYNPNNNNFFVIWEDERNGDNVTHAYARFVSGDGQPQGTDFAVNNQDALLMDLDYDQANNQYIAFFSERGNPYIRTISASGTVSDPISSGSIPTFDQAGSIALNSSLNQRWMAYVDQAVIPPPSPGLRGEDNRIKLVKFDSATNQQVGTPMELSTPHPGYLAVGLPYIAYSPVEKGALVIWMNWDVNGVYGRMVYDNGTMGPEKPLVTPQTHPQSSFYRPGPLYYNQWTNQFYFSAQDNEGGTVVVRVANGSVLGVTQSIAPISGQVEPLQDNQDGFVTPTGFVSVATSNYESVVVGTTIGTQGSDPALGSSTNPYTSTLDGTHGIDGVYNPTNNTFLLVATKDVGGTAQVFGEIYDQSNYALVVPEFRIDQSNGFAGSPLAVYNPQTNQYFVAWEDARDGSQARLNYARLINADGTMPASEIPVNVSGNPFLEDLDYDPVNNRYVIVHNNVDHVWLRLVNADGSLGSDTDLDLNGPAYDGQASLAVNAAANEYWVSYVESVATPGATPRPETNRIMMVRVDAATMQKIGEPVQVSEENPGILLGSSAIAFDPNSGQALVTWVDYSVGGIMGATVDENGIIGSPQHILTPLLNPESDSYGSDNVSYNPQTGTFFIAAQDGNGGTMVVEVVGNTAISVDQVIAPAPGSIGQFNATCIITPTGCIGASSRNYDAVTLGTSQAPPYTPPTPGSPGGPAVPNEPADPALIGQLVSQLYLWALGVAGVLALIMMIIGGYMVMTSAGNAATATKGREYIYSSLIGLGLLLVSYLLLSTINPDLTQFDFSFEALNNPPPDGTPTP